MSLHNCLNKLEFLVFKISKLNVRNVSISTNNYKNYVLRQTKIMNKLMYGSAGKKRKFVLDENKSSVLPTATSLAKGAYEGKRSVNSKRINVLNKLFMKYISDLMATGECSKDFLGRGIEISRVQTAPDFKVVNVFWVAKGLEDDDCLENVLNKNAGLLRHELSQLRVIGVVPKIKFVKDKHYAKLVDVDERLRKADFGDDYVPIDPSFRMKSEFSEKQTSETFIEDPLPPMRHDVFGLNHTDMMIRLKRQIKKAKALHRSQPEVKLEDDVDKLDADISSTTIVTYPNMKAQKEAFQMFLNKQQRMKAKAKQNHNKNYSPEQDLLCDQILPHDDVIDIEDNDFVLENEDRRY